MQSAIQHRDLQISVNLNARLMCDETRPDRARVRAEWTETAQNAPMLEIAWRMPLVDIQYDWFPGCGKDRSLRVDWYPSMRSRISANAPVWVFYNAAGRNRFTVALSDARADVRANIGVREEDGTLLCKIAVPLDATGQTNAYEVVLYRDWDDITLAESARRVARWWETDCGMTPMPVPECARLPLYSAWYSFHQATIASDIEAECARAAKLGFRAVIVDDGWQTGDGNRGYGYCGDWEVEKSKIPDMRAHVAKIHDLGMKYILWYSVPFMGARAKRWDEYKDMLLDFNETNQAGTLDPRYPKVRAYLIGVYERALRDWNLDGFKLDFIDSFIATERAPAPKPGMDCASVEEAVLRLMTDVMKTLSAIKPDILIEFRQSYIGPAMRTFGNMFRVSDCPADPITNRVGMVDLRMLSGNTAVHSDMLMWHKDDTVQNAARQILNVLFAVPQISVRLDLLPEDHLRMLTFWMDFIAKHRALLAADIESESPECLYPLVRARLGEEEAVAVYDRHVSAIRAPKTYLFNATSDGALVVRVEDSRARRANMFDCFGEPAGDMTLPGGALCEIRIPASGFALLQA